MEECGGCLLRIISVIFVNIGIGTRYLFFKLIGKKRTYDELAGIQRKKDWEKSYSIFNTLIGIAVVGSIVWIICILCKK